MTREEWLALALRMEHYARMFEGIDRLLYEVEPKGTSMETIAADCRAVATKLREDYEER